MIANDIRKLAVHHDYRSVLRTEQDIDQKSAGYKIDKLWLGCSLPPGLLFD